MTNANQYAAIYKRTSSEEQAKKASPEEQERDCRAVAEQHGLTVLRVYSDIERYRVKGRMVEPSGTRDDRPGLLAMLADAAAGQFGTIIAWREDRLYRSPKACVKVLGVVESHKITVLLARENFDQKFAHLKAWMAGMEVDAIKERMTMGIKARLRAGKATTGFDRYGYRRAGEKIVIVEEEARWVRKIYEWYVDGATVSDIRQRLIAAGAPQKGSTNKSKHEWSYGAVQNILKHAWPYAAGVKRHTVRGEVYEIPIEPIIDMTLYQRVIDRRANNRTFKADNIRRDYLLGGLLYSRCGKWHGQAPSSGHRKNGQYMRHAIYRCNRISCDMTHEADCPKTISSAKADRLAWAKIVEAVDDPELLIAGAQAYIDSIRTEAEGVLAEQDRLQRDLDNITSQRQWVITQARVGKITDDDMSHQLAALVMQEINARKSLTDSQHVIDVAALGQWEAEARDFLADVQRGIAEINQEPATDDERREAFELKRFIVRKIVSRVDIDHDRDLKVTIKLEVPQLIEQARAMCAGMKAHTLDIAFGRVLITV